MVDHDEARAREGLTLPPNMSREQGSKKRSEEGGPKITLAAEPMPANKVKADWQGETKQALLDKIDMLPMGVRDFPRASLVPPRSSTAALRSQTRKPRQEPQGCLRLGTL